MNDEGGVKDEGVKGENKKNVNTVQSNRSLSPYVPDSLAPALKLNQDAAPGESSTETHHKDQIARLDDAVAQVFIQN